MNDTSNHRTAQPDHTKHNFDRLNELEGTKVRLDMNIETHGIHTVVFGILNKDYYRSGEYSMVGWTVTTEDGTKIKFSEFAVTYIMANTEDILIQIK